MGDLHLPCLQEVSLVPLEMGTTEIGVHAPLFGPNLTFDCPPGCKLNLYLPSVHDKLCNLSADCFWALDVICH